MVGSMSPEISLTPSALQLVVLVPNRALAVLESVLVPALILSATSGTVVLAQPVHAIVAKLALIPIPVLPHQLPPPLDPPAPELARVDSPVLEPVFPQSLLHALLETSVVTISVPMSFHSVPFGQAFFHFSHELAAVRQGDFLFFDFHGLLGLGSGSLILEECEVFGLELAPFAQSFTGLLCFLVLGS